MYFGSVKFFKHLIIGTAALLIIIPCVLCIVLGIENGRKDQRIAELSAVATDGGDMTPEQMLELYDKALDEDEKERFLNSVYKKDGDLYEQAKDMEDKPDTSAAAASVPLQEAEPYEDDDDTDEPEDDTDDDLDEPTVTTPITTTAPAETTVSLTTTTHITTTTTTPATTTTTTTAATTAPAGEQRDYSSLYPDLYAEGTQNVVYDSDKDYVYLTFDDGPSKYTENILYYLEKYDLKATFFVVPDGSAQCAERLRRIADAGHTIGIHTASHVYKDIYASVDSYLADFALAYNRVFEATGIKCRLFRFPGGSINDFNGAVRDDIIAEMTRRGFIYFDWNVDSNDAMGATWTEMYNNVLTQTANVNRAVILMHDYNGGYNTVLVLEDIIKALISDSRGYKLSKLTETVKPVQF